MCFRLLASYLTVERSRMVIFTTPCVLTICGCAYKNDCCHILDIDRLVTFCSNEKCPGSPLADWLGMNDMCWRDVIAQLPELESCYRQLGRFLDGAVAC